MSFEKDSKKRQKEIMKEWKINSSQYTKTLKSLEDLSCKLGVYSLLQFGVNEEESLAGVQNDDIVIWKQHVTRAQQQLYNSLKKLRELIDKRKKVQSASFKTLKVSYKRQSKKFLNLEELQRHLEGYGSLTDDISTTLVVTERLIAIGNKRVVDGELSEENATKLRDELVTLNSRWNKLNVKVLPYVGRCEQLVDEIVTEYKNLSLWIVKAENMEQWLAECEKLVQREKKPGNEMEILEEQQQDVEEFLKEGKEYRPSALDVLFIGEKIVQANRLEKQDMHYVEKVVVAMRNRWNSLEEHLEARQKIIQEQLDTIKKGKTAGKLKPWREKANNLSHSLNESKEVLDSVDEMLKDGDKYETLRQCTLDIKKIEHRLLNENSEALTEVSSSGSTWVSQRQLSRDDDEDVEGTVDELHRKMSDLEEAVKLNKERVNRSTSKIMNLNISECEQSINDLDNASVENFAAVGTDASAVQKQIDHLEKFEDHIETEEQKLNQITKRFEEATGENMIDEPNRNKLKRRLQELEWRYKELWKEHDNNKERILRTLLQYSSDQMAQAHNWLINAEAEFVRFDKINGNSKEAIREFYDAHKRLSDEIVTNEPKVKAAVALGRTIVREKLIKEEDLGEVEKEMNELEDRMENLKTKNTNQHIRFDSVMKENMFKDEQPIELAEVNEVQANLPENFDGKPSDEGFSDGECYGDSEEKIKNIDPKFAKFLAETKDINEWIDQSNRLIKQFYKRMHTKDAWKKHEMIEKLCDEKESRQMKINVINKLGTEIIKETKDKDISKDIDEELVTLNNRWTDCLSMLETAREVDVPRDSENEGCSLCLIMRRRLRTICAYN